jgi:hypothetical protein
MPFLASLSPDACPCFIVSVVNGGGTTVLIEVASLTRLAWFFSMGFYLIVRGGEAVTIAPCLEQVCHHLSTTSRF